MINFYLINFLIVNLLNIFYLGELFDAYLNREISHKTRIIMVMRAYFFLNFWKSYIEKASEKTSKEWYSTTRSFISIQSYHIFKSLAESLVLLIILHRDYYEDYPLLPWEHGTEALEHVFGLARQLIPDFTAYEFFKILRRVMHCDKILRTGDFGMKKEKVSATGLSNLI